MGVEQSYRSALWRVKPHGTSGVRMTLGSDGSTLAEYFGSALSPAVLALFNHRGSNRIVRIKEVRVTDPLPPVVSTAGNLTLGLLSVYAPGDEVAALVPMNTAATPPSLVVSSWAKGAIGSTLRRFPSVLDFPAWTSARPLVMTGSTPHTIALTRYPSTASTPIVLGAGQGLGITYSGSDAVWRTVTAHFSDGTDTWVAAADVFFCGTTSGVVPWAAFNSGATPLTMTRLEITPINYWVVTSTALLEVCRCSGVSGDGLVISAIPNDTASTAFDNTKITLATECIVTLVASASPQAGVPRDYPIAAAPIGLGSAAGRGPRWRGGDALAGVRRGAAPDTSQIVLREGEGIALRLLATPLVHPGSMGMVDVEILFTVEDNTPPPSGGGGTFMYGFCGG